mmetsp:Transcript_70869/g.207652  ORF Transcript_70869/g.207652 Transcript_70869/m.207652 type:complete len:417 (-) Transcript_70869:94-1344(-)
MQQGPAPIVAAALLTACLPGAAAVAAEVVANSSYEHYDGFLAHEAGHLRDHPPGADYNKETTVARLSVTAEGCVALVWILMVCSMPMVAIKLEGRKITRSQFVIFAVMWITFLGGVYLFTNILLFKSVHFEGVRSLTIVECVYLFSQMLTTVGYGDIVPARPRAQVFVGLYVVFNLMIIANVMSDVTDIVLSHTKAYYQKLKKEMLNTMFEGSSMTTSEDEASREPPLSSRSKAKKQWMEQRLPPMPWKQLVQSSMVFVTWCVIGVFFYVHYPGEDRTTSEAIYMSVISLSTVGFGVYTPITEVGKVFGAFWMLFGSFSLVWVVGCFNELMGQMKARETFAKSCSQLHMSDLFKELPDRMDLHDFTCFALLYSGLVEEKKLNLIDDTFKELGPSDEGNLSKEAVQALLERCRDGKA